MDHGSLFGFGRDNVAAGIYDLGELGFGVDGLAKVREDAGREDVVWDFRDVSVGCVA